MALQRRLLCGGCELGRGWWGRGRGLPRAVTPVGWSLELPGGDGGCQASAQGRTKCQTVRFSARVGTGPCDRSPGWSGVCTTASPPALTRLAPGPCPCGPPRRLGSGSSPRRAWAWRPSCVPCGGRSRSPGLVGASSCPLPRACRQCCLGPRWPCALPLRHSPQGGGPPGLGFTEVGRLGLGSGLGPPLRVSLPGQGGAAAL